MKVLILIAELNSHLKEQCFRISSISVLTRAVSSFDKEMLKAALTELSHGSANNAFGGVLEHCFSSELVDDIVTIVITCLAYKTSQNETCQFIQLRIA